MENGGHGELPPVLLVLRQSPERWKLTQDQPSWQQVMGWRDKCGVDKSCKGQGSLNSVGKKDKPLPGSPQVEVLTGPSYRPQDREGISAETAAVVGFGRDGSVGEGPDLHLTENTVTLRGPWCRVHFLPIKSKIMGRLGVSVG